MNIRFLAFLGLFFAQNAGFAQPNFTANDWVPAYAAPLGFGVNLGYYPPHYTDENLALLAHGSPDGAVPGLGATCIRPALFEHFLDYWGYDIRLPAFRLYDSIGLRDNTVFLGFPAPRHRDSTFFCPDAPSEVFRNLYAPIWDDGKHGTPVNDDNPFALYVWKTVSRYGKSVRFWEIWNEPDFDLKGNGWKPVELEGNWWTNTPGPCETALRAPVYYYIRMLRISYEIIKSIDSQAFVCVGGLGYPSYLDVVCRLTDNPSGGAPTADFPKKGGAYFDCLSYHAYPHIDGSLRQWNNAVNGFIHFRHSDAAVAGVWAQQKKFENVLEKHGYDGQPHPKKQWIVTEVNIPRRAFGDYIGSDEAQTNFLMKTYLEAPANGVDQLYVYSLADAKSAAEAANEFDYMGLVKNLNGAKAFDYQTNRAAIGFKTASQMLRERTYDADQTARLQLPPHVRGVAFRDKNGQHLYALWANTRRDRDETASATFAFPEGLKIKYLRRFYWNHSATGASHLTHAEALKLDGSPAFFTVADVDEADYPREPKIFPSPVADSVAVFSFWLYGSSSATVEVFDAKGRRVSTPLSTDYLPAGAQQILLDWAGFSPGTYFVRVVAGELNRVVPVVKI